MSPSSPIRFVLWFSIGCARNRTKFFGKVGKRFQRRDFEQDRIYLFHRYFIDIKSDEDFFYSGACPFRLSKCILSKQKKVSFLTTFTEYCKIICSDLDGTALDRFSIDRSESGTNVAKWEFTKLHTEECSMKSRVKRETRSEEKIETPTNY